MFLDEGPGLPYHLCGQSACLPHLLDLPVVFGLPGEGEE